ncbi:MAG: hypothetical protein HY512_04360 [Candidatus Aenigmarchaeota archaeon]|nr:hypothetical protein [Candidatus Aenigmarchaeota archaeon]
MKSAVLVVAILLLSIPLALADWSQDADKGEGTISIPVEANKWVLIGMNTDIPGGLSSTSEIKLESIKAGWLWDAEKQDYVVHIANGKNVLENAPTGNSGFWVLPTKSGILEFKVDLEISKDRTIIDRINLEDGFNFVYILPSMEGRSMFDLGRNCNMVAMYAFVPELQEWTPLPLDTPAPPQSIGRSILVENSGTCSLTSEPLTTTEPTPIPPQLPPKTTPVETGCPATGIACSEDCPESGELEDGTPCETGVWNVDLCDCEQIVQPEPIQPADSPITSPTQTTPAPTPSPTSNLKSSGESCSQNSDCQSGYCTFGTPRVCS